MEYTRTFSDCPGWVFTVTDEKVTATFDGFTADPPSAVQRRMEELDWTRRMAREWRRLRERTAPVWPLSRTEREELTRQRDEARTELAEVRASLAHAERGIEHWVKLSDAARAERDDAVRARDNARKRLLDLLTDARERLSQARQAAATIRGKLEARTIERDNARTELEHWRGPVLADLAKLTAERDDLRGLLADARERLSQARQAAATIRDLRGLLADARERLRAARAERDEILDALNAARDLLEGDDQP